MGDNTRRHGQCVMADCDNPDARSGFCWMHLKRFDRAGIRIPRLPRQRATAAESLSRIGWTVTASGCWEFNGSCPGPDGYGRLRGALAHRVAFIEANGQIPQGLFVCHRLR